MHGKRRWNLQERIGFGTECNGYSDKCALKQYYDTAERIVKGINKALKINLGIKGDNE